MVEGYIWKLFVCPYTHNSLKAKVQAHSQSQNHHIKDSMSLLILFLLSGSIWVVNICRGCWLVEASKQAHCPDCIQNHSDWPKLYFYVTDYHLVLLHLLSNWKNDCIWYLLILHINNISSVPEAKRGLTGMLVASYTVHYLGNCSLRL